MTLSRKTVSSPLPANSLWPISCPLPPSCNVCHLPSACHCPSPYPFPLVATLPVQQSSLPAMTCSSSHMSDLSYPLPFQVLRFPFSRSRVFSIPLLLLAVYMLFPSSGRFPFSRSSAALGFSQFPWFSRSLYVVPLIRPHYTESSSLLVRSPQDSPNFPASPALVVFPIPPSLVGHMLCQTPESLAYYVSLALSNTNLLCFFTVRTPRNG